MESSDKDNVDDTSVKPVSSLRSQFENMAGLKSTSPVPAVRKTSKSPLSHGGNEDIQAKGRSSLDIPSKPSPWGGAGSEQDHQGNQDLMSKEKVVSRNPRADFTLRQRPLSMGPISPSRSPPAVTVISPKSPPKSPRPPNLSLASVPCLSSPLRSPGMSSAPRMPPSPPQRRFRSRSPGIGISSGLSRETTVADQKINTSDKSTNQAREIPTRVSPVPPPVNRAEKPKVALKLSQPATSFEQGTLRPERETTDDRVSPFSTPPSSEGSPGFDEQNSRSSLGRKSQVGTPKVHREGFFSPPPINHHGSESKQHFDKNSLTKFKTPNYRENRFLQDVQQSTDPLERRPSLPPRREVSDKLYEATAEISPVGDALPLDRRKYSVQPPSSRGFTPSPVARSNTDFLPPPKRNISSTTHTPLEARNRTSSQHIIPPLSHASSVRASASAASGLMSRTEYDESAVGKFDVESGMISSTDYPDPTKSNRRPPFFRKGVPEIDTKYDTRLFDLCGQYICTTGYMTRAWDLLSGEAVMTLVPGEKESKITSLAFKPGATADDEGRRVWLGTSYGDIQEVDLLTQSIVVTKAAAHARREVIKMYRYQNTMWSLDDDGKLHVWLPDDQGLPNLQFTPLSHRVPKGHTFSIVVKDHLWIASGKDIRIYRPNSSGDLSFNVLQQPLNCPNAGEITSGAVISSQLNRVYFGHVDGKVTIYSTLDYSCLGVVNVSVYKISSLTGAGDYLWAGYKTGMIYVYDTRTQPWTVKKDWHAHDSPVASVLVDRSSVWKVGRLQIASIGTDNAIRIWDGMLEEDWLENDMQEHDTNYCQFREIKAVVATWNAGATTPAGLRYDEKDSSFFREVLQTENPPDILVFGFQELVDLEDKRLTAKSFFKGNKKKDSSDQEHMSRQYRAWRDYLIRCIEVNMPSDCPYHLLHTANMVGLFSCVFIKASERENVRRSNAAEVKTGLGGLHGNKGALVFRFILDDSSLCFINCHLAAGQTQTVHRNNDVATILESAVLPTERDPSTRMDTFTGGGDGSMILDHEICVLNGDLNYRIDTMGRDTVVKAVHANDLTKLLERDQLLVSRKRNPGFRLRAFNESPITFAPTYKYDVGTDRYDSSEKNRSPAWCDRLLYRGVGRIRQIDYRRHELRMSDHRPVSGTFRMRIKSISPKKRVIVWQECERRFADIKEKLAKEAKIDYLVSVLGIDQREAQRLIKT